MRVLQVAPAYYPAHRHGGPIKSVHELSQKLVKLGVDVAVYTTNINGAETLDVPLRQTIDLNGVKVSYFPVTRPRAYVYAPELGLALERHLGEFDLVHINGLYLYPTMRAARSCRRRGLPYIIAPRGMLDPNAIIVKSAWKKKLYLWLVESKNLMGAAALHFTSLEEQQLAATTIPGLKGFVVPNALDLMDYLKPPAANALSQININSQQQILFLGRINPKKGLDLLIPAFARAAAARPQLRLVIAGPDEDGYLTEVQAMVAHHSLQDRVTYTGMLLGSQKLQAFYQATMFILPSYSENFGIVVAEAMACCRPVVITNRVNIYREVEQAKAGLVTACDPEQIAEAILKLLDNPDLRVEMGYRGRKLVEEKFTWDRVGNLMLQKYQQIIHAKTA